MRVFFSILLLAAAMLAHPVATAQARRPPAVLILIPETPLQQQLGLFIRAVSDQLTEAEPRTQVYTQVLPLKVEWRQSAAWMHQRFGDTRFDAVVVWGQFPLQFAVRARGELWPQATIFFAGVTATALPDLSREPNVVGLLGANGIQQVLELSSAIFPAQRKIAVLGPEAAEGMRADFWELVEKHRGPLQVIQLTGLSEQELRARVANLPKGTMLALMGPARDAATGHLFTTRVLREIAQSSPVPVFSDNADLFGYGILGGTDAVPTLAGEELGRRVADLLVHGRRPAVDVAPPIPPPLRVDWRLLKHYGVDTGALPAGVVVEFQPPNLWDAYRAQVIVALIVIASLSLLVIALVIERQRRQRAQREAAQRLAELARHQRAGAVGAMSLTLAHELNQPLASMLASAETIDVLIERPEPPHGAIKEALDRIFSANRLASEIVSGLRRLVRREEAEFASLVFDSVVAGVLLLLRPEAERRGSVLATQLDAGGAQVQGDLPQLQQVVLNLVINAMDAMRDAPQDSREVRIVTSVHPARGEVRLQVLDRGHGLPEKDPERIFESFYTTKASGLGLGLSISRGLVQSHGGSLKAFPREGGGACFELVLPLALEERTGHEGK